MAYFTLLYFKCKRMLSWKNQIEALKCLFFPMYVPIYVLKSLLYFKCKRMLSWKNQIEALKCLFFPMYVPIYVLKSFSFQLLLRFVRSDFHLHFISVLRNISVFVSVNEIISISVSVSVNEYITADNNPNNFIGSRLTL